MINDIKVYKKAKDDKQKYLNKLKDLSRFTDRGDKAKAAAERTGLQQRLEAKIAACDLTMKLLKKSSIAIRLFTLFR